MTVMSSLITGTTRIWEFSRDQSNLLKLDQMLHIKQSQLITDMDHQKTH